VSKRNGEVTANLAVVSAIRSTKEAEDGVALSTGVRAILRPVSPGLIDDVTMWIVDPEPPLWHNKDYDRDEPNPVDPTYLKTIAQNRTKRIAAQIDAVIAFGVELVDGVPPDSEWVPKLKMLSKLTGHNILEGIDLTNPEERKFAYCKYIAVTNKDMQKIMRLSMLLPEEIEQAVQSFPGAAGRAADRAGTDQELG
jgi:hypothetical protein